MQRGGGRGGNNGGPPKSAASNGGKDGSSGPPSRGGGGGGGGGQRPYYRQRYNRPKSDRPHKEGHGDTQRDVLIRRLKQNQCDCMICCERIARSHQVWSCLVCYNIFHLKCIRSWATKQTGQPESSGVWRCPACNAVTTDIPTDYKCFCGKVTDPKTSAYNEIPHTCGQPCQRPCKTAQSVDKSFPGHPCGMLCHPGPCGPCSAFINRSCKCGRLSVPSQCSTVVGELDCGEPCEKQLSCGKHKCQEGCHPPPCQQCPVTIPVACYCGNNIKSVPCDEYKDDQEANKFSCLKICGKKLSCGNHLCYSICHSGECPPCARLPSAVKTCPCGRMSLLEHDPPFPERVKCDEPIPTCGGICKKKLPCGDGLEHFCPSLCHDSECPPCTQSVSVRCQCGRMTESYVCSERPRPLTCVFRCNKKLSCRKHKCANLCCTSASDEANSHICTQPCNRLLSCGQHRCVQLCGHSRDCPPCYNASFDELSCFCGNSVLYPPVPCGAKPPPCDKPCTRQQACSHPPNHNCHPDPPCPACMVPVSFMCIGGHQKVTVPCSTPVDSISCGKICDKRLPCGHRCTRVCHGDPCTSQKCRELCMRPRQSGCGHPCSQFCHEPSPCPPPDTTPCTFEVEYRCRCGLRIAKTQCPGSAAGLQALQLSCDERCGIAERNRRLAEALQLNDVPLLPQAPITVYPPYIQEIVQRQPNFALDVETVIVDLVKGLGSSSPGTRASHSFKPMVANFRRFIHELVPFYGCEAQAYDAEPNRNVVVYATSGRCYLPASSLQQAFPTAFVGISQTARANSPSMMRSARVAQLPPAARAPASSMQFEKLDSWRSSSGKSVTPNTAQFVVEPPPPPLQPQMELIQKPKRGKKEKIVSCFDETGDVEEPVQQTTAKTNGGNNGQQIKTTTLITGAGPIRFALPSYAPPTLSNKFEAAGLSDAVPDHWDDCH